MFDSIGRSWELAKGSFRVLRSDKELLIFPFLSLVVPVLVVENVGPFEAIKRSTGYLKRTWGEQLIGNVGIGLVFGLLTLLVLFVGGALLFFLFEASVALGLIGVVALILLVGVLALIGSAMSGIFTASVYRYATKGDAGSMFNNQVLVTAFRQKR